MDACTTKPTRHRTPWTLNEIKRANELIAQGYSRREVAAALGRTVFGLRTHLPRRCRPTRPDRHVIEEMIEDGMTRKEMADVLKVDISTVQRWMNYYCLHTNTVGRLPDPMIRSQLISLIQEGHNSRSALCVKLQRHPALIWQWLTELRRNKIIKRKGQGRATRYYVTRRWTKVDDDD